MDRTDLEKGHKVLIYVEGGIVQDVLVNNPEIEVDVIDTDCEKATLFINSYACDYCGNSWKSKWECPCNDHCADCNREIEPYHSKNEKLGSERSVDFNWPTTYDIPKMFRLCYVW